MAKALFGHVGGPDPRIVSEMRRLQQRVRDLEAELVRLQEENNSLSVDAGDEANGKNESGAPSWRPSSFIYPLRYISARYMSLVTRASKAEY
jgi:hypothetical protein